MASNSSAVIYPIAVSPDAPDAELKVRNALMGVPDIIGFHSIHWQARRNGKQADGECDFILIVPSRGILLLEVKGGGVHIADGQWKTRNRFEEIADIKNPFEQVTGSKYALVDYFKATLPKLAKIPLVHAVSFPDITVPHDSPLTMDGNRNLIIDRADLTSMKLALHRIFDHWGKRYQVSGVEISELTQLLAPTVSIQRKLKDEVADAASSIIELTAQQIDRLWSLNKCKKALITGGAGTGKTVLAVEKARRIARNGLSTLIICFNAPLRESLLREIEASNIDIETFHSLVIREMKKAKLKIPSPLTPTWFEKEAAYALMSAIEATHTKYDALIIDEAQDFSTEWIDAMKSILASDSSLLYFFADSHQNLYSRGWQLPSGYPEFGLDINCRNTSPIASKVCRIFADESNPNSISGPDPVFHEILRQDLFASRIARLLETLILEGGLTPFQIIVLSDSVGLIEELRKLQIDDHPLTDLGGYGIPIESIYRFKGLEREVVILAMTDGCLTRDFKALAYVGMSRAKSGLHVFGSPKLKNAISWT